MESPNAKTAGTDEAFGGNLAKAMVLYHKANITMKRTSEPTGELVSCMRDIVAVSKYAPPNARLVLHYCVSGKVILYKGS